MDHNYDYLTEERKQMLYKLYLFIMQHQEELKFYSKKGVEKIPFLDSMFCYDFSWRVVGITESAVKAIKCNNYYLPRGGNKGLQRDHFIGARNDSYIKSFANNKKVLEYDEWWDSFWNNDPTVLMLTSEHSVLTKKRRTDDYTDDLKYYPIDWRMGLFKSNVGRGGYEFGKRKEGAYIKERIESGEYLSNSSKPWTIEQIKRWKKIY